MFWKTLDKGISEMIIFGNQFVKNSFQTNVIMLLIDSDGNVKIIAYVYPRKLVTTVGYKDKGTSTVQAKRHSVV